MNTFIPIIVIICIASILLFVYYFYYVPASHYYAYTPIKYNTLPVEMISSSALSKPASPQYAIAAWIYVYSWNTDDYKILITKTKFSTSQNTFQQINSSYDFCVYLDTIQPNLICRFNSMTPAPIQPITLMKNVPLQKWTYILFSVDSQVIDAYINGKLAVSHKMEGMPQTTDSGIIFGNGVFHDIQINNFQRWDTSLTPQKVWDNYVSTKPTKTPDFTYKT